MRLEVKITRFKVRHHNHFQVASQNVSPMNHMLQSNFVFRCVLRSDNCLYYYKSSKHKDPCGVIILSNYSVSKAPEINRNHCFKLTKGGAKSYCMCAGSEGDMKKWMVAMMDAIKDAAKEVCMYFCLKFLLTLSCPRGSPLTSKIVWH